MTRKQVLEMTKDDAVIIRNDGRVIQDQLGNIKTFTPKNNYKQAYEEIIKIIAIVERINASYTFSVVRYVDLPEELKY